MFHTKVLQKHAGARNHRIGSVCAAHPQKASVQCLMPRTLIQKPQHPPAPSALCRPTSPRPPAALHRPLPLPQAFLYSVIKPVLAPLFPSADDASPDSVVESTVDGSPQNFNATRFLEIRTAIPKTLAKVEQSLEVRAPHPHHPSAQDGGHAPAPLRRPGTPGVQRSETGAGHIAGPLRPCAPLLPPATASMKHHLTPPSHHLTQPLHHLYTTVTPPHTATQ